MKMAYFLIPILIKAILTLDQIKITWFLSWFPEFYNSNLVYISDIFRKLTFTNAYLNINN